MYVSVVRKTTTKQPVVAILINVSARKTVLVAIAAQIQVAVNKSVQAMHESRVLPSYIEGRTMMSMFVLGPYMH